MLRPHDADSLVLAIVNAPWRRSMEAATLLACLRGEADIEKWKHHLATFFSEVPREAIDRYAAAHGLSPERLLAVYRAVRDLTPEVDPALEAWLGDLGAPAR